MISVGVGIILLAVGADIILRKRNGWFYANLVRSVSWQEEVFFDSSVMQDALSLFVFVWAALVVCVLLRSMHFWQIVCWLVLVACLYLWYRSRERLRYLQRRWYEEELLSETWAWVTGGICVAGGIVSIILGIMELGG